MAERAAAMGSLIALAGAASVTLVEVTQHVGAIVLEVLGLLLTVIVGWYAVSRRGPVRVVALILVCTLAALVTGLILTHISVLRVCLVIAAGGASVGLARPALRRVRALGRADLSPAARAAHPVLILNPRSGGGKAERFCLKDECARRGIEAVVLGPGDDLLELAEDAVSRGADVIGMAGGDGSQALVATVAARHGIPHVCVPAGTRNHFALDLGLDRGDVAGALDAFENAVECRIDLAAVNGRIFVNNASLGLYAKVVQSPDYRDAKLRTAATRLPELLGPDADPLDLRFRGPDGTVYPTAQLILVSNDPYQLDHAGGLGTRERMDRGVLGVVAARIADAADAGRFAALQAAGQVRRFPGWAEWNTPRFEVGSGGRVEIGVDGETLLMDPPLVFESLPGALRVRLPRRAAGASPAARAVALISRSTISDLVRVARGHLASA
jgi:diacylglycerol kinase family enzyme